MRGYLRSLSLAAVLLSLAGCVLPATGTYYAPTAAEGEATGSGGWYAPNTFRLERGDNVVIEIFGGMVPAIPEQNKTLHITVMVRPGVVLHLPTGQIKILSVDSKEIAHYARSSVDGAGREFSTESLEAGVSELAGDRIPAKYGDWYHFMFQFAESKPDVFRVELPAMSYGGTDYPALEVTFTKTDGHWWQVYGP